MRSARAGLIAMAAALSVTVTAPVRAQAIIDVPTADAAMAKAMAEARATLPKFWDALARADPGDTKFYVKIRFPHGAGSDGELIWAGSVVRDGDQVTATIDNEPRHVPNLKHGQRVAVPIARVSDWMFTRAGKLHGAYTVRVLLPRMQPAQADGFRQILADPE